VFGTTVGADGLGPPHNLTYCDFNSKEKLLSEAMMSYWTSFMANGDPNQACIVAGKPCTEWPQYISGSALQESAMIHMDSERATLIDGTKSQTLLLTDDGDDGIPIMPAAGLRARQCSFWSKLYGGRRRA